jgi:hypothetical protein
MNVANILKVADAIEQHSIPDLGFNMAAWYGSEDADLSGHRCGTVACIAGWTMAVLAPDKLHDDWGSAMPGALLGLAFDQHRQLFIPQGDDCHGAYDATPAVAAKLLRILAITGKVDWNAAMKSDDPVLPPVAINAALSTAEGRPE